MHEALFAYEPLVRLGIFAAVFVAMAVWELLTPRRPQAIGRNWRWPNNLGVLAVDALLLGVLLRIMGAGLAFVADAHGCGLFNIIALPSWASIVRTVIVLQLAMSVWRV